MFIFDRVIFAHVQYVYIFCRAEYSSAHRDLGFGGDIYYLYQAFMGFYGKLAWIVKGVNYFSQ